MQGQKINFGGIFRYLHCAQCGTLSLIDIPEEMGMYYGTEYYSFNIRKSNRKNPVGIRVIVKFCRWFGVFVFGRNKKRYGAFSVLMSASIQRKCYFVSGDQSDSDTHPFLCRCKWQTVTKRVCVTEMEPLFERNIILPQKFF